MKFVGKLFLLVLIHFISGKAFSQQTSFSPFEPLAQQQKQKLDSINNARIQKEKQTLDSTQRKLMKDSLGLTDVVISQFFASRDSYIQQADQIRQNSALSQSSRMTQMELLRKQTAEATKELMGATKYDKYLHLITGQ